jgi:hypothetical protein
MLKSPPGLQQWAKKWDVKFLSDRLLDVGNRNHKAVIRKPECSLNSATLPYLVVLARSRPIYHGSICSRSLAVVLLSFLLFLQILTHISHFPSVSIVAYLGKIASKKQLQRLRKDNLSKAAKVSSFFGTLSSSLDK